MIHSLSPNTQAILLLTAPLIVGRGTDSADLLTSSEYKRLARFLRERQRQPSDLLSAEGDSLLRECHSLIDSSRLKRLLERGFLLSQAMERWQPRAIWVISRADANYPKRLKTHLKEDAPPVLYGCGEMRILDSGALAVVGSRNVDDELIAYTENIGRLAVEAQRTVVSGGARGVDQAAMRGALEAGGKAVGVLADSLERASMSRENRSYLMDGRLALISPYDPSAGFNVGHAMQRNKLIYALADAALVVNADFEKGGTWAGAAEQLDKLHFVPVYVRSSGNLGNGLDALRRKGALPWPNPATPKEFAETLVVEIANGEMAPMQNELRFVAKEQPGPDYVPLPEATESQSASSCQPDAPAPDLAGELFAKVRELLLRLPGSQTDSEVAIMLNVSKNQAKEWLERSVKEGWIEKRGKPARYIVQPRRQPDLFNDKERAFS